MIFWLILVAVVFFFAGLAIGVRLGVKYYDDIVNGSDEGTDY